jgi:hypothetical protein
MAFSRTLVSFRVPKSPKVVSQLLKYLSFHKHSARPKGHFEEFQFSSEFKEATWTFSCTEVSLKIKEAKETFSKTLVSLKFKKTKGIFSKHLVSLKIQRDYKGHSQELHFP